MRTSSRFSRRFANFHQVTQLAMGLSLGLVSSATADPVTRYASTVTQLDRVNPGDVPTGSICSGHRFRCFAHAQVTQSGLVKSFATPQGWGPADLQSAYQIDPTKIPAT